MTQPCDACETPTDAPLCRGCTDELRAALRAVPGLLAELEVTHTRQDRLGSGNGGRSSGDSPVAWKEHVPGVVLALGNTVTGWARELSERRGLALDTGHLWRHPHRDWSDPIGPLRPVPPPPLDSLRFAAGWLIDQAGELRQLPDARRAHDEITDAVAGAHRAVDRPAEMLFAGPCGGVISRDRHGAVYCDRRLYCAIGAEVIECPTCHTNHDVAERRDWLIDQAHDQLVTYDLASQALSRLAGRTLPMVTLRQWVHRGQLQVRRYLHRRPGLGEIAVLERQSPADRPLVRVGDVIALLDRQPRGGADRAPA